MRTAVRVFVIVATVAFVAMVTFSQFRYADLSIGDVSAWVDAPGFGIVSWACGDEMHFATAATDGVDPSFGLFPDLGSFPIDSKRLVWAARLPWWAVFIAWYLVAKVLWWWTRPKPKSAFPITVSKSAPATR
jgi:hypothetical protein